MSQANPTDVEATKYAESYILYGDKTRAFRAAFPNSKATKESQHTKAGELHNTVAVQLRIKELREGIESDNKEAALYNVEQKKLMLLKIAQYGMSDQIVSGHDDNAGPVLKQINPSAAVSAIKELNLMDGDHAAKQVEFDGPLIINIEGKQAKL